MAESSEGPSGSKSLLGRAVDTARKIGQGFVGLAGVEEELIDPTPLKDITEALVASRIAVRWDHGFTQRDAFRRLGYTKLYDNATGKEYEPSEVFPKEYSALGSILIGFERQKFITVKLDPKDVDPNERIHYWVKDQASLKKLAK